MQRLVVKWRALLIAVGMARTLQDIDREVMSTCSLMSLVGLAATTALHSHGYCLEVEKAVKTKIPKLSE